ncbi:hypothetical protein VPH35_057005 [Triticum aestivum]|uniref:KIB1-4 beta-propeller domain-containing protein n=1 Tax=Triticum turgidum subsp. durum TaxID=4567 RepID=A0A9R1SAW0_TRITD|nr:unnamed protein product [Triticum turgidum subsp. durum]
MICDINGLACVTAWVRRWAFLDPIRLDDGDYRTFPIWRSMLTPPSPSLLVDHNDDPAKRCITTTIKRCHCNLDPHALLMRALPHPFRQALPRRMPLLQDHHNPSVMTCLGSCSVWLSLFVCIDDGRSLLSLFQPVMAAEILLPPLIYDKRLVSKMVFTPNPTTNDFLAAVICDINGFACVTAGARRWAILDPIRLDDGDQLTDLLYHRNGMVYCPTRFRDVHVLHLPQHRCRNLSSSRATH